MKKFKYPGKFTLPVLALALLFTFSLCDNANPPDKEVLTENLATTPTPNVVSNSDDARRPNLDTLNFSDTTKPIVNLSFHIAVWDYFKWLTSESTEQPGKLVFETMYNAETIGPNMTRGKGLFLTQSVKDSKAGVMGGIHQAESDGILIDKNGRAVYSSMHIDPIYHGFIEKNKLWDPNSLQNFDANENFPDYAFSLKVTWKIVGDDDPGMDDYYTTEAEIAKLKQNGSSIVVSEETETDKVAMVGFHIALIVPGHPEMIWGTFENVKNAPDAPANLRGNTEISAEDFTFYTANTTAQYCNQKRTNALKLDEKTQVITPSTEVYRAYPYGNIADLANSTRGKSDSTNLRNILALNEQNRPKTGVWSNYEEIGAIWFNQVDALQPSQKFSSSSKIVTGSRFLSNATIETFTQDESENNQCFGCHNTMAIPMSGDDLVTGKNVLTSHILVKNYVRRRMAEPNKETKSN